MSLVAWYPLNNNLNNQGCSNIETLHGTPKSWSDGKVTTKTAYWENSTANALYAYTNTPDLIYFKQNNNFSYALWLKKTFITDHTNYAFTVGRADMGGLGYGLQILSATSLRFRYGNKTYDISNINDNVWYHIVFTDNNNEIKIYINGELKTTQTFNGTYPTYSDAHGLGLGCFHYNNATGNIYPFTGAINDFRIYNHCLSLKEVKELANMTTSLGISIDNTGNFYATKFEETTNNKFEKGNTVKTAHFMENYITEPDGAVFQQIAFHLDPTTYKFASSDNFNDCYKDCRRWFNAKICDLADKWEFLLIQRATESAATKRGRWLQTKNPNTATFEDVAASTITKRSGYTDFGTGGIYKNNNNAFYVTNNGTKGNWWGAIGAWGSHNGGIPGWFNDIVKDGGYQSLYIRIDNLSDTAMKKIHAQIKKNTNTIISNQFYEFI